MLIRLLVGVVLLAVALCSPARAAAPAAVSAVGMTPVVPLAAGLGKDLATIPLSVAEVVRLPMGLVECVLSPLPGISFRSGLQDMGAGIVAPFKLVMAVLRLPYDLTCTLSRVGTGMSLNGANAARQRRLEIA